MDLRFACRFCGSPSVRLPQDLTDESLLVCSDCEHPIETWGDLKRRAVRIICAEVGDEWGKLARASSDPLRSGLRSP
jgi:hypothetical protein